VGILHKDYPISEDIYYATNLSYSLMKFTSIQIVTMLHTEYTPSWTGKDECS